MAELTYTKRRQVVATASGRQVWVKFQQLTGASTGGGFPDGGSLTDVPGLTHVPVTFRTMRPYERMMAGQLYPALKSWAFMRYRRSANVRANMYMVYGNHLYRIQDVGNYDESNQDVILYLEEWQPSGTTRQ
jgi:hypothetical protein